jgi:hypothetical protein
MLATNNDGEPASRACVPHHRVRRVTGDAWAGDLIIRPVSEQAQFARCLDVLHGGSVEFDVTAAGEALVSTSKT